MLESMTGYASLKGEGLSHSWTWDLRSVNAKGLDLRLRVPDWIEGLEPAVRGALSKGLVRGSVNLSLRVQRDDEQGALSVNSTQLDAVLAALQAGLTLALYGIPHGPLGHHGHARRFDRQLQVFDLGPRGI